KPDQAPAQGVDDALGVSHPRARAARHPVEPAQLVEDGAPDAMARVRGEAHAALRIELIHRGEGAHESRGEKIVEPEMPGRPPRGGRGGGELERAERRREEPLPQRRILRAAIGAPELEVRGHMGRHGPSDTRSQKVLAASAVGRSLPRRRPTRSSRQREAGARGGRMVNGTCWTTAWGTAPSMTTQPASPGA